MDAGLEKVVAAETVLSDVQGAEGRLIIRGQDVETLARDFTFEQAAEHLWGGFFDVSPDIKAALGKARAAAFQRLEPDFARLVALPEVEAVRAALIQRGVAPARIIAAGYGSAQPLGDNATEDGRAMNRRIEIRLRMEFQCLHGIRL